MANLRHLKPRKLRAKEGVPQSVETEEKRPAGSPKGGGSLLATIRTSEEKAQNERTQEHQRVTAQEKEYRERVEESKRSQREAAASSPLTAVKKPSLTELLSKDLLKDNLLEHEAVKEKFAAIDQHWGEICDLEEEAKREANPEIKGVSATQLGPQALPPLHEDSKAKLLIKVEAAIQKKNKEMEESTLRLIAKEIKSRPVNEKDFPIIARKMIEKHNQFDKEAVENVFGAGTKASTVASTVKRDTISAHEIEKLIPALFGFLKKREDAFSTDRDLSKLIQELESELKSTAGLSKRGFAQLFLESFEDERVSHFQYKIGNHNLDLHPELSQLLEQAANHHMAGLGTALEPIATKLATRHRTLTKFNSKTAEFNQAVKKRQGNFRALLSDIENEVKLLPANILSANNFNLEKQEYETEFNKEIKSIYDGLLYPRLESWTNDFNSNQKLNDLEKDASKYFKTLKDYREIISLCERTHTRFPQWKEGDVQDEKQRAILINQLKVVDALQKVLNNGVFWNQQLTGVRGKKVEYVDEKNVKKTLSLPEGIAPLAAKINDPTLSVSQKIEEAGIKAHERFEKKGVNSGKPIRRKQATQQLYQKLEIFGQQGQDHKNNNELLQALCNTLNKFIATYTKPKRSFFAFNKKKSVEKNPAIANNLRFSSFSGGTKVQGQDRTLTTKIKHIFRRGDRK